MLAPGIIINADDLGIHPRINAGIVSAYRNGVLTSATLLVTTPYLEQTIRDAVRAADLPVGIHLSLTLGKAVAPAAEVVDLVDEEGYFKHSARQLLTRSFGGESGHRLLGQIRREVAAQLALARDWGVTATHCDSHQHVHMHPAIRAIVEEECRSAGINRLRLCREPLPPFAVHLRLLAGLRRMNHAKWLLIRRLARGNPPSLAATDAFFGLLYSGIMSKPVLRAVLNWARPDQSLEIGIHPGFPTRAEELTRSEAGFAGFISAAERQEEHDALVDDEIAALIRRRGLNPRSYDDAAKSAR